jgi:RNA polymerase sigma-70 factor (ECF subfamily)
VPTVDDIGGTSSSLIGRVRQRDPQAWRELAALYGPLVYRWARQCGLQDHDAADVAQDVFSSVARNIDEFRRDQAGGTFRGWLWTITRNSVRAHFRNRERHPAAAGGTDAQQQLADLPAILESDDQPDGEQSSPALARRALQLIRAEFEPRTWQAFERLTMLDQPVEDVAAELQMTPAAVRQAKYRVLVRIRQLLADD